jgi:hypothetical protein
VPLGTQADADDEKTTRAHERRTNRATASSGNELLIPRRTAPADAAASRRAAQVVEQVRRALDEYDLVALLVGDVVLR